MLCTLILFCTGCGAGENLNVSGEKKIYLVTMDNTSSFWEGINNGCKKAIEESDKQINYRWIAPNERNVSSQSGYIDLAIEEGADAIIISAISLNETNESLKKADEAGVKIIYIDSAASYEPLASFMTDNEIAGETAAKTMLKAFENAGITSGTIAVAANDANTLNTSLRDRGFRKIFEDTDFEIVQTLYMSRGVQDLKNTVAAHPEYVGFFGTNQSATLAIGEQLEQSATKQIVVGFDVAPQTVERIKSGVIYATMKQDNFKMGYDAMKFAIESLNKKTTEKNIYNSIGVKVITKENLNEVE